MRGSSRIHKLLALLASGVLSLALLGVLVAGGVFLYFNPELPAAAALGEEPLSEPLRIYTADGRQIAEFGLQRRFPVSIEDVPPLLIHAFVAAEDDRFFEHPGVDWQGILRAAWNLLLTGEKSQGGSTITMQLARNVYLSSDRTYARKLKEIILALRLEAKFTKDQILELYLNKIYLGNSAYGVGTAARTYYGKTLDELTIAQAATLAGLPKAPSYNNPAEHPERARIRRDYVLRRMREEGYITADEYTVAASGPVTTTPPRVVTDDRYEADYLAEMARRLVIEKFGEETAYTAGYHVVLTVNSERQRAANRALRRALLAYDQRHQWRGAEATVPPRILGDTEAMDDALAARPEAGGLVPALVLSTRNRQARLYTSRYGQVTVAADALVWLDQGEAASSLLASGDIVRLAYTGQQQRPWVLAQIPDVQGALVALDPHTGAIEALVGGFEFSLSQFNRAVQAYRQPGSAFKPFLYSAALANGFTPATVVNDVPVVLDAPGQTNDWRPENYGGDLHGPTRLRVGLVHSRNLVSIRVLRAIGIKTAIDYIEDFGLPGERMPRGLSLALGTATFTPLMMARADAVFANGGYLIDPFFIREIRNAVGEVVYRPTVLTACTRPCTDADKPYAPRVISPQNAWLMVSMMHDVVRHGTGHAATRLGRHDLAGKTGTTDETRDSWFTGFNQALVAACWVGFDHMQTLGSGETGSQAALPMWIYFMDAALEGVPETELPRPPGLVTVSINPDTGLLARPNEVGIQETFRVGQVPPPPTPGGGDSAAIRHLF